MSAYRDEIRNAIRTIENWPNPGVMFRDITPLLKDPSLFYKLVYSFVQRYQSLNIDTIAAIDARGFLIGAPLAYELELSLVPVRKQGKLPYSTISQSYELEYGHASIELHTDAFAPGSRVVVMDDLIATEGTMLAACQLIQKMDAEVVEVASIIDLPALGGSQKLRQAGFNVFSLCEFEEH